MKTQHAVWMLVLVLTAEASADVDPPADAEPHLRVAESGDGRFVGTTGEPIRRALRQLPETGGTVIIEPGVYVVRKRIIPPPHATIRGADASRTTLRLPSPTLTTAAASKGDRTLSVADSSPFRAGTTVELLPPEGDRFEELEARSLELPIASVDAGSLTFAEPLPLDLPKAGRVGYAHHIFAFDGTTEGITIENLTLAGGRTPEIPMPGHAERCAVWAASPYTYAEGPRRPPISRLVVRHCNIRECYGRAVAMYNVVDSAILGCRISRIDDEAINFDHFNERCRAEGNLVRDAKVGVTLNDTSHCIVRYNRLIRCGSGVRLWWWHKVDPEGVNEHNTIEHNVIRSPHSAAIYVSERADKNTVRYNFVEGPVEVAEPDKNTVHSNTRVSAEDDS